MVYKVVSTEPAESDVEEILNYITQNSPEAAIKWWFGFWEVIKCLEDLPFRFALIPEIENTGNSYRSCFYHSHRIIYRIDETNKVVYIVRVYHGAREPLTQADF